MQSFNFELKTKMVFGSGSALNLWEHIKSLDVDDVIFVVDKNVFYTDYFNKIFESVEDLSFNVSSVLYECPGEPTYDYLDRLYHENHTVFGHHDIIVAVGGGSVIDTAKGLAVLSTNLGPAIQYRGFPEKINKPIPVVAIPTTAGTGSEVTFNAVFIDTKEKKKLGINSKMNYPVLALLDPNLIITCPQKVMLSSALDALVHSVESYGATKSNELTRLFSRRALLHLRYSLPDLRNFDKLQDENKLRVASDLQLGAYYAGIALMNSGSGPAGAMSYVLGANFNVPHGLAGGVFLPHIIAFNEYRGFRYTDFSDEEINFISLFSKIDFDFNYLRQFGINESNIVVLLNGIETLQPAFDQNTIPFKVDDAKRIIRSML